MATGEVREDLCSSLAATPAIHQGAGPLTVAERGHRAAYPSIGILGRFIVVPEAQAGDALGSVEADRDHVVQPRREGDQPHVLTLHGDVGSIDQPAGSGSRGEVGVESQPGPTPTRAPCAPPRRGLAGWGVKGGETN